MTLEDGLYQVWHNGICAGFEVKNGQIINCAPILRKRLAYWITKAKRIKNHEPK